MKQHQILLTVNDDVLQKAMEELRLKDWIEEFSIKLNKEE